MHTIEDLLKILNSDLFIELARNCYKKRIDKLNKNCQNEEMFISYLKALYVEMFQQADTNEEKEYIMTDLIDEYVDPDILIELTERMNTSFAKPNDIIDKSSVEYLKELKDYENDPLYPILSEKDDVIEKVIVEGNHFTYMKDIKAGTDSTFSNYKISEEEIEILERAKLMSGLNNMMHALYDENNGINGTICKYDSIEDESIKALGFHTNKNNPEYEIICEDGTILNYYKGNIKVKPFKFSDVMHLTKLSFINHYYNGSDNEAIATFVGEMDEEFNIYNMTDEELEENLLPPFLDVYANLYGLDQVYSKKMIEESQKELLKMKQIVKKYNF